jgi:hypothetical protein
MNRILKVFLILAVAAVLPLAGWAVPPVAATSEVTVSLSAPAEVTPDSNFTAAISISEVVDFDACNYDVYFDESVLRLDSVNPGMIGSTGIPVDLYNELSPGSYRVIQNVPGLAGASGSGYLAEMHFHVVGTAGDTSLLGPSNGVISDITALEIEATWLEGTVTVANESSQAPPATPAASPPQAEPPPPGPEQLVPPSAPSAGSDGVPVLWLVAGGAVFLGLIILFVIARRRAY